MLNHLILEHTGICLLSKRYLIWTLLPAVFLVTLLLNKLETKLVTLHISFAAIQFHPKCQSVLFEAPSPCGCRNAFENGNPVNLWLTETNDSLKHLPQTC